MNLESIRLSERNQPQKIRHYMISFLVNAYNMQISGEKKLIGGCLALQVEGLGGKWRKTANRYRVSLGDDGNILKLIMGMVA